MPTKRPVKPSAPKKRAAAPAPKRGAADRKMADALLRESEELYESLFRNNHAVMLIIDPEDGRIVDANRAAVRFYGYTARKLKTLRISDINMLDAMDVRLKMNQALKEEQRYFLFLHRLADDTIRDVEVCSGPVTIKGRKLLYSLVHDITERKSADESLRFEREQLFSMFDSMETVVYVADPFTHEILYTNKALENALGKPVVGGICHREFQGLEAPCPFCTNDIILRQYPAPHHWEYHNPKLGKDFSIIDRVIKWPDGRNVRVEFATDITERKMAEEALRDSERRYRLLVDNAEIAVVITSMTTGEVLFGNQRASVLFDVPMDKVVGRPARQHWVHPEDRDRFIAELTGAGRVTDYECALKTAKGAMLWVLVSANVIEYAGEKAAFVVYNDITERKRAEEALRDSLETASAMLNAATESFALIDSEGLVLAANETFARRLGRPLDVIIGTSIYGYLEPSLAEHRRERYGEVIQSGQPLRFSDERGGRWLEHSLYPIFDSRGKVSRLVIYTQDITDRRRSEEALRQSEILLKSIFQAAPIGIGLVYNRVLGWTNDQLARMLGYPIEELAEKSARILYESDEEFERVGREKYIEVRQGGIGVIETQWKRKDGAFLDILLSSKAIDPADISAGVVFTALDITDRKRSEEALQRYQDELEQRVRERTSELMVSNQALILEIEDRNRADKALRDSERRLSDIIDFLPDATFVIDRDGKVIAWNRSMETMTGIPAKDMLGKGNYEYAIPFYGERRPMLVDMVLSADEEIALRYAKIQRRGDVLFGETDTPRLGDRKEKIYLAGTAAPLLRFPGKSRRRHRVHT